MVGNVRAAENAVEVHRILAQFPLDHDYKKIRGPDGTITQARQLIKLLQSIRWSYDILTVVGTGAVNKILQRLRNLDCPRLEYEEIERSFAMHFEKGRPPLPHCEIRSGVIAKYQLDKTTDQATFRGVVGGPYKGALCGPRRP